MALPGIIGLLIFIYMRPHEFVPALASVPFLYVFLALAVLGIAYDVATGRMNLARSPQLGWAIALVVWALFTLAIRATGQFAATAVNLLVCFTFYWIIGHGIPSVKAFGRVVGVIFALGLFVACVGVHQRNAPTECVVINPMDRGSKPGVTGRPCANEKDGQFVDGAAECYEMGEPGLAYACEHVGLFETSSIGGGRVRYLGVLTDPNELALATAIALPFAFAFYEQRRKIWRLGLLFATLAIIATEIVYTQSRGGQLCLGSVLGAYFVKRFGWKRGFIAAGIMVLPMLLLGGRKGEEADQSSLERIEAAAAGFKMLLSSPIWGIGYQQFTEHHYLTAHNAYVLSAAELGVVGALLFSMVLYVSVKIPIAILQTDFDGDEDEADFKALAMAMLAAMAGLVVGIFFLSWTYHYVLWIHLGLSAGLYNVVRARNPWFEVKTTAMDMGIVFVVTGTVLSGLLVYTRFKGGW